VVTGIVVGSVVAIVGAIGTYIAGLKMQRERWRREDQIARRTHVREFMTAARLIDEELARARVAAAICVVEKRWWSSDIQLTTEAWQNHKAFIVPELSDTDWRALSSAVLAAENLSTVRGDQTGDISEGTAERIVPILREIEAGRSALAEATRSVAGLIESTPGIEALSDERDTPDAVEEEPERAERPPPLRERLRRAYRGPGGVGCSVGSLGLTTPLRKTLCRRSAWGACRAS
jgi:hypothetical protein